MQCDCVHHLQEGAFIERVLKRFFKASPPFSSAAPLLDIAQTVYSPLLHRNPELLWNFDQVVWSSQWPCQWWQHPLPALSPWSQTQSSCSPGRRWSPSPLSLGSTCPPMECKIASSILANNDLRQHVHWKHHWYRITTMSKSLNSRATLAPLPVAGTSTIFPSTTSTFCYKLSHLGSSTSGWPVNLNFNNFSLNDFSLLTDSHTNALAESLDKTRLTKDNKTKISISPKCVKPVWEPRFCSFPKRKSLSQPWLWRVCLFPRPELFSQNLWHKIFILLAQYHISRTWYRKLYLCHTHGDGSFPGTWCSSYQHRTASNLS